MSCFSSLVDGRRAIILEYWRCVLVDEQKECRLLCSLPPKSRGYFVDAVFCFLLSLRCTREKFESELERAGFILMQRQCCPCLTLPGSLLLPLMLARARTCLPQQSRRIILRTAREQSENTINSLRYMPIGEQYLFMMPDYVHLVCFGTCENCFLLRTS